MKYILRHRSYGYVYALNRHPGHPNFDTYTSSTKPYFIFDNLKSIRAALYSITKNHGIEETERYEIHNSR